MKYLVVLFLLILSACAPTIPAPTLPAEETAAPASAVEAAKTPTPAPTNTSEPTATATNTPAPTATITPTVTNTPVAWLRVTINVENAVCHYAPGKPYLYKYAVHKGYTMEAISRDVTNTYVEVQAIGGDKPNPCWVNADFMDFQGEMASLKIVQPEEIKLPMSPYYAPPVGIKAERTGDEVTLTWVPLNLKAGDSSEQTPYILEAWVCLDGKLSFQSIPSYQNRLVIRDETGCAEPSRARLLAAEKHGYTRPVEIDWPAIDQ